MGARLKELRERADLTQSEVAERMGMSYSSAKAYVSMLEQGRVARPMLETIVLYLKACGAKMDEFFGRFNSLNFVDVEKKLDTVWDAAKVKVAGVKESEQARARAEVKADILHKTRLASMRYQLNVPYAETPGKTAPEEVARRAGKLAEYRMQTSIVERKVQDYLDEAGVKRLIAIGYIMFARSVFGVVRKERGEVKGQKSKVKAAEKLAEKWRFVEEQGLEPEIARKVQEIAIAEWEKISGK